MKSGIYKLYWDNCDYFYYGQSTYLKRRKSDHLRKLRCGVHDNQMMQRVFYKYGEPIIEFIEYHDIEYLNEAEQKYIDMYFGKPWCCNLSPSAETRKGKFLSEATKRKLRIINTGKVSKAVWTTGMKKNISIKNSGSNNGMFGRKILEKSKVLQRIKLSGENNYLSKLILNLDTGIYCPCLREAAETINMDRKILWCHLSGKYKRNKTSFIYV